MADDVEELKVLALLKEAAASRIRTARAILAADAANALPQSLDLEQLNYWNAELADAEQEFRALNY